MTERSTPGSERQVVCPFVAFDDDRDFRSSVPDHRHRCFAESPAATRALAHQAAYCLSTAFPGCPTFIDWARREAAPPKEEPIRTLRVAPMAPRQADRSREPAGRPTMPQSAPASPPRQPRAEWTAPPPWAPDAGAVVRAHPPVDEPVDGDDAAASGERDSAAADDAADARPSGGAWSGSALAGLASVESQSGRVPRWAPTPEVDVDDEPVEAPPEPGAPAFLAGRATRSPATGPAPRPAADQEPSRGAVGRDPARRAAGYSPDEVSRPPVPRRGRGEANPGIGRSADRPIGRGPERIPADPSAPSWERPRRFDTYPSLRSRGGGVTALPRPVLYGLIVLVVGIALFATPFLFRGITGGGGAAESPAPSASPSLAATTAPSITPVPSPSPTVYVVKSGDVLSRIAARFGVTVDQIVKANPQIKNPDKLNLGDQLVIPPAVAPAITDGAITPAP